MLNLAISIPNTKENIDLLVSLGYEKRSGSAAYKNEFLCVLPFKLWFWETNSTYSMVDDMKNYI